MIASNCPRCDEPFRLPAGQFPDDAYAACPWCRETFPISEVIEKLPPVLQVLSADGQPLAIQESFVAAAAGAGPLPDANHDAQSLYSGDQPLYSQEAASEQDYLDPQAAADDTVATEDPAAVETWASEEEEVAIEEEAGEEDAFSDVDSFVGVGEEDSGAWTDDEESDVALAEAGVSDPIAPMKVSPAPTRAKKKGSPVKMVIGVLLGPVIAVPLAGAILLAIGRAPDLGFWPFDGSSSGTGRTQTTAARPSGSPRSIPLNTTGRSLGSDLESDASDAGSNPAADALAQISGKPKVEDTLPDPIDDPSAASIGTETVELVVPEDVVPEDVVPEDVVPEDVVPEDVVPGLQMPDLPSETAGVATPNSDPAAAKSSVETASATESIAADSAVAAASANANELLGQLIGYEGPEKPRRKLLAQTYAAIAAVGAVAGENDAQVDALVGQIVQSSLLDDFGAAAPQWMGLPDAKRPSDGALLIGSPGEGGQTISLPKNTNISVSGMNLPNAKRVLGLGRIVKSESGQLEVELVVVEPLE